MGVWRESWVSHFAKTLVSLQTTTYKSKNTNYFGINLLLTWEQLLHAPFCSYAKSHSIIYENMKPRFILVWTFYARLDCQSSLDFLPIQVRLFYCILLFDKLRLWTAYIVSHTQCNLLTFCHVTHWYKRQCSLHFEQFMLGTQPIQYSEIEVEIQYTESRLQIDPE